MIGARPLAARVAVLFALTLSGSTALQAQQTVGGRFRVLIPDFQPINDEDDDFGKDLADELRDLIDDMLTHRAVDEDDIKDALKKYGFDMEDLNCITARQLAQQENYQVVLCAGYAGSKEAWQIQNIRFVDSGTGEVFEVDPIMSADKMEKEAAAEIVQRFELFSEQIRAAIFCGDYAQSQQWEDSLRMCDRALELNPNANTSRYTRANVLKEVERYDESLAETQRLLVRDPFHENALLLGGFVATTLENNELARGFYSQYLLLDPTNAAVRMSVAYDLAQQGDPLGGMLITEEGVALDPDNIEFYERLGDYAFLGAERIKREAAVDGSDGMTPEVRELYRKAITAYERVFLEQGEEMLVSRLRNVTAAQTLLGNLDEAIAFGERAVAAHPEDASLRDYYARALKEAGHITEAVAALAAIEEIDPDWPNLHLRMADWLIEDGRVEEAVPVLQSAVARGSAPDEAANRIFVHAHSTFFAPTEGKDLPRFIELVQLAKQFEASREAREQYHFFHGYALLTYATGLQETQTPEMANRTLPMFREAASLFEQGKGFADRTPGQYQQVMDNVNGYIEIQEAVIARASRGR